MKRVEHILKFLSTPKYKQISRCLFNVVCVQHAYLNPISVSHSLLFESAMNTLTMLYKSIDLESLLKMCAHKHTQYCEMAPSNLYIQI